MKIAFVSSECAPFAKTGGLADVSGTLPQWIRPLGHDIRVFMPKYRCVDTKTFKLKKLPLTLAIPVDDRMMSASVWQGSLHGKVPVYFIEYDPFFDREYLYGTLEGDYPDNDDRFIFFSRAVLELLIRLDFRPDIIHSNDWQTGLVPAYVKTFSPIKDFFFGTATIFTIHNIAYQGLFHKDVLIKAGLGRQLFSIDGLEYYGQVSFLKSGIAFSDRITTVSTGYAEEIQSGKEFGFGMEGLLKKRSSVLTGILNGIDYREWNPRTDRYIDSPFLPPARLAGKAACKKALQKSFGLVCLDSIPVIGMVSRLAAQKGFDLLTRILSTILKKEIQLVILGTGDIVYHKLLQKYADAYARQFGLSLRFDSGLAHRIYAGSDLFLMPSRFEPCGLGQMIAMRYGSIPVVMKTGGLADTVVDYTEDEAHGTGIVFNTYQPKDLARAVQRAVKLWKTPRSRKQILQNMAAADFTWKPSAEQYVRLFDNAHASVVSLI